MSIPFDIPAVRALGGLAIDPKVTFLIGENGSGKSTVIEAVAIVCGFNPEGGTKNFTFETHRSDSSLREHLKVARGPVRERDGFFLRAESLFNLATSIEELGVTGNYGGKSLHAQSHGESFLAVMKNRFGGNGLYILDEPEAALSPTRQLALLALMYNLIEKSNSQFIIATHSPILMAYPGATICHLSETGINKVAHEDTEHYQVTRDFLNSRDSFLGRLMMED